MQDQRFWVLLAKKMAGEIDGAGLEEQSGLLAQHPELNESVTQLEALWSRAPARQRALTRRLLKRIRQQSGG